MTFNRVLKHGNPRSGPGWQIDHFAGYFRYHLAFCLAWPRPLVVGGALMVFAVLLEGAQAFMPDRSSYYLAALYSAAGVLAAALFAELFARADGFRLGLRRSNSAEQVASARSIALCCRNERLAW